MKHFYYNPYSLYKSMEFTDSLQSAIDGLIDDELSINEDAIIYHFNDSNDVVEKIIISRESLKILYSVTISEEFQLEEYSRCRLFKSSIL